MADQFLNTGVYLITGNANEALDDIEIGVFAVVGWNTDTETDRIQPIILCEKYGAFYADENSNWESEPHLFCIKENVPETIRKVRASAEEYFQIKRYE